MSYRFTNTEKWADAWFSELKQIEMLLFIYLCDNCDIAGFIEVNYKRWAVDLGSSPETLQGACKGLARGLIFSTDGDCIYLKNFLKHQKNIPLNENNKAHSGIIKRFVAYSNKFDIQDINQFIEGASKGLPSPTGNGNGNGNGIGNEKGDVGGKTWKTDFQLYLSNLNLAYRGLMADRSFIAQQEKFNPGVDIGLTIEKAISNFWGTEAGWKNKLKSGYKEINWRSTFQKTIDINKVYKPKPHQPEKPTCLTVNY